MNKWHSIYLQEYIYFQYKKSYFETVSNIPNLLERNDTNLYFFNNRTTKRFKIALPRSNLMILKKKIVGAFAKKTYDVKNVISH